MFLFFTVWDFTGALLITSSLCGIPTVHITVMIRMEILINLAFSFADFLVISLKFALHLDGNLTCETKTILILVGNHDNPNPKDQWMPLAQCPLDCFFLPNTVTQKNVKWAWPVNTAFCVVLISRITNAKCMWEKTTVLYHVVNIMKMSHFGKV